MEVGRVQLLFLHWNWPAGQILVGQFEGSSLPSAQSFLPSHLSKKILNADHFDLVYA
jgi:hypothetical protein